MLLQKCSCSERGETKDTSSEYRAKQTAGHLRIRDIICIVAHTSSLKTNAHDTRFELSNLRLFLCLRRSNADKFMVLGCYDHNLNTDRKR